MRSYEQELLLITLFWLSDFSAACCVKLRSTLDSIAMLPRLESSQVRNPVVLPD